MKNKKAFLDISFSWIFALIVGAIILGGAIYGVSKFTHSAESISAVKGAQEITILFDSLESSFELIEFKSFTMPVESRIYTSCDLNGNFGTQGIKLSEKIKSSWSQDTQEITSQNRYLFSDKISEGKTFNIISKPFEFPFKVASLIYVIPSNKGYCFVDAPSNIKKELNTLNNSKVPLDQRSIRVGEENCGVGDKKVCFDSSSCDISVNYNQNYLTKSGDTYYFEGDALMFAAIFSDKGIYDCQVKRLMKRTYSLVNIYLEKDVLLSQKGCSTSFALELSQVQNFADNFDSTEKFLNLGYILRELENKNRYSECALW